DQHRRIAERLNRQRHRQARTESRARWCFDAHCARGTEVDTIEMNLRLCAALQTERKNTRDHWQITDAQLIFHAGLAAILAIADAERVNARLRTGMTQQS